MNYKDALRMVVLQSSAEDLQVLGIRHLYKSHGRGATQENAKFIVSKIDSNYRVWIPKTAPDLDLIVPINSIYYYLSPLGEIL